MLLGGELIMHTSELFQTNLTKICSIHISCPLQEPSQKRFLFCEECAPDEGIRHSMMRKEQLDGLIHFLKGCVSLQVCRTASSPAVVLCIPEHPSSAYHADRRK